MKILFVNEFLCYGGAEQHIFTLRGGLESRGHQTAIVTKFIDAQRKVGGGDYATFPEALRRFQPDLVHLHNVHAMLPELAFVVGMRIPHVLSLHDYWPFCPLRMGLLQRHVCKQPCGAKCSFARTVSRVPRELTQAAQVRVAFNPYSAEIYRSHSIECEVIPHGISVDLFKPAPIKKAQVVFLASQRGYLEKGEDYFDMIMGREKYLAHKVIGKPHAEVRQALAESLVFMHTGYYEEPFCLAIVEAMASGCAVLSFDVAGARSIITRGTGLLFPVADCRGMRIALEELLNDPREAIAMGKRARNHVLEHFNSQRMAEDYERLYQRIHKAETAKVGVCGS